MRSMCWLLISAMCMLSGCYYMKPHTDDPITFPVQGVAMVEEMPETDTQTAAVQQNVLYTDNDSPRVPPAANSSEMLPVNNLPPGAEL